MRKKKAKKPAALYSAKDQRKRYRGDKGLSAAVNVVVWRLPIKWGNATRKAKR